MKAIVEVRRVQVGSVGEGSEEALWSACGLRVVINLKQGYEVKDGWLKAWWADDMNEGHGIDRLPGVRPFTV